MSDVGEALKWVTGFECSAFPIETLGITPIVDLFHYGILAETIVGGPEEDRVVWFEQLVEGTRQAPWAEQSRG